MPTVVPPDDIRDEPRGPGSSEATLADAGVIGAPAMVLRRLTLEPGARTEELSRLEGEEFLYVIRGDGNARVADVEFRLEAETVLWLEPDDRRYRLEAGPEGLEVLAARSPGT
jgi:quercetin dioxygenase-like cupin family protein